MLIKGISQMDLIFTTASAKRFLYVILVTLTAFVCYHVFANSESYWLLWSAFLIALLLHDDRLGRRCILMFLTAYIAAMIAFLSGMLQQHILMQTLFLFFITIASVYIGLKQSRLFLVVFPITLFALLAAALPVSHVTNSYRFNSILGGGLIAIFYQLIFIIRSYQDEAKYSALHVLNALKKLNQEVFDCFLQPFYNTNLYLYERRLHMAKTQVLLHLQQLRALSASKNKVNLAPLRIEKIDSLFDITLSYSQLRHRVSDYSTFQLCEKELIAIKVAIDNAYTQLMKNLFGKSKKTQRDTLSYAIGQFEENYHHVLQVSAREPLIWLLFLNDLKQLQIGLLEIV